jgi:prolyl-tRNA synthetase
MGIQAVPMKAASGPIGGDLSHEFIVLAPTGESEVFYDAAYEQFDWQQADLRYGDETGLQDLFDRVSSTYAATDETHDEARWTEVASDRRRTGRGIEVGHIFYFGDKYSAAMGLQVSGPDGTPVTPMMGSYGVGVSRLVGAVIEASHDDAGIIWPESIAPWIIGLVNMRQDDPACTAVADDLYSKLQQFGDIALYDDRDERGGVKLGSMDVIGLPWQFIVGPKSVAQGMIETKNRRSGQRELIPVDRAVEVLSTMLPMFGASAKRVDPNL